MTVWTQEMKHAAMADAAMVCKQAARIAELEAEARSLRQTILTIADGGNDLAQAVVEAYARNGNDLFAERRGA